MTKGDKRLEGLIRDNSDMLGRMYYSDIRYQPDDSDMSDMPVKYGASEHDWNEVTSHNPEWSEVNVSDVRFVVESDGCYYFAGKDGFVWNVMSRADMDEKSVTPDVSDLTTFAWFTAVPAAASDVHHMGGDITSDAINYGWYLARVLSRKVWDEAGN